MGRRWILAATRLAAAAVASAHRRRAWDFALCVAHAAPARRAHQFAVMFSRAVLASDRAARAPAFSRVRADAARCADRLVERPATIAPARTLSKSPSLRC